MDMWVCPVKKNGINILIFPATRGRSHELKNKHIHHPNTYKIPYTIVLFTPYMQVTSTRLRGYLENTKEGKEKGNLDKSRC